MTDINSLENQLKEEFEMFSIAISRSDVMDKRKILPDLLPRVPYTGSPAV